MVPPTAASLPCSDLRRNRTCQRRPGRHILLAVTTLLFSTLTYASKGHHGANEGHHGPNEGHHVKPQATSDASLYEQVQYEGHTSTPTATYHSPTPCVAPGGTPNRTFSLGLAELPSPINANTTPSYNTASRYLTTGLSFSEATGVPAWSFAKDVDWRYLLGPPDNQDQFGKCGSCWSFAVSAAVQAAYAIQGGQKELAVEPSQQQFLDCSVGSCEGGYPQDALQYAANPAEPPVFAAHVYAYTGKKGTCRAPDFRFAPSSKIAMFEQTAFQGPLALMLAVQRQPVVVNLRASAPSFQNYQGGMYNDPTCYDVNNIILDHSVLVVGYHFQGLGQCANNYWILRNSWGTQWGEHGHMRMAMVFSPTGVCGITAELGLYPVIKAGTFRHPCSFGVCGGGSCTNSEGSSSSPPTSPSEGAASTPVDPRCKPVTPPPPPAPTFSCNCSSQGFLAPTTNIDGTQSCISKVQCGLFATNPCGQGTCVDDGSGGYSCICPAGSRNGQLTDGTTTCVPVDVESHKDNFDTYTAQQGDTCYLIYTLYSLTEAEFRAQNPSLDCSQPLTAGTVVNVKHTFTCSVRYPVSAADEKSGSCATVQAKFPGVSEVDLQGLNPGLDCSKLVAGQQLCLSAGTPGFNSSQLCTQYVDVTEQVTCEGVVRDFALSFLTLYQLNPGLLCDNLNALGGQQICVKGFPVSAVRCSAPTQLYRVKSTDSCITIVVQKFKKKSYLVPRYNNGWICTPRSLFGGLTICVP